MPAFLYGDSSAENLTNMVNSSISSVLMQSSSSCQSQLNSDQQLTWNDLTINASDKCQIKWDNINQTANIAPNMSCAQSVSNAASLQTDLQTKLQQNATAVMSGLPTTAVSKVDTSNVSNILNQISNSVNMTNLSQCIQSTLNRQSAQWSNFKITCTGEAVIEWSNITQTIIENAVMKCTQETKGVADLINQLSNELSQTADSEDKGFDLGGILMGVAMVVLVVVMIITVVRGLSRPEEGQGESFSAKFELPPLSSSS